MLKISEAANLAIHAMAYLGCQQPGSAASVSAISRKLCCSESHLAKVLNQLAHKGLLISSRGAKGGFKLCSDAGEMTTLSIIEVIDGPIPEHGCMLGHSICSQRQCVFQDLYGEFRERLIARLEEVKIVDIQVR
ncbi:MAG: Rrf2 family transcriptional regulator [Candidatus Latescibacterota bacterium]